MSESPSGQGRDGAPATPAEESPGTKGSPPVHAATLLCENCGRSTVHRILRWDPRSFPHGKRTQGVARCRECGWTHPFDLARRPEVEVTEIVSKRSVSTRERVRLATLARLAVGDTVPGSAPPLRVRRIELKSGGAASEARAGDVATLWVTADEGLSVPVSILEGARTRPARWAVAPDVTVAVGAEVRVEGSPIEVVAIRAAGRTWRHPGDQFQAGEVQRVYGRRTVSPPAGRSDWRRGRGRPSSRTSSFSRSSRSRSGPGVRSTRRVPRARTASGGAAHQSVSPS